MLTLTAIGAVVVGGLILTYAFLDWKIRRDRRDR